MSLLSEITAAFEGDKAEPGVEMNVMKVKFGEAKYGQVATFYDGKGGAVWSGGVVIVEKAKKIAEALQAGKAPQGIPVRFVSVQGATYTYLDVTDPDPSPADVINA